MIEKLVEILSYITGRIWSFGVCAFYAIPLLWEAHEVGQRIQRCGCFSEEEVNDITKQIIEKYLKKIDKALRL